MVGFDAAATETVWSREDRETLLAWFSAAVGQLSDAEVETLRALPLFEREDGSFVPLTGLSQPRTVPEDLPGIELLSKDKDGSGSRGGNGDKELLVVFRRKTAFDAIYETLGIKPLTELELYRDHIFPRFHALSDSARLDHLRHALRYADVKLSSEAVGKLCDAHGRALSQSFGNFDRVVGLGWLLGDAFGSPLLMPRETPHVVDIFYKRHYQGVGGGMAGNYVTGH